MRRGPILLILLVAACGQRQAPYRFRSPLLGSVAAAPLPADSRSRVGTSSPPRSPPTDSAERDRSVVDHRVRRPGGRQATASRAARTAQPAGAPRPTRHSIPSEAIPGDGEQLASRLREQVGRRDDTSTHIQVALAALRDLGVTLDPALAAVEDGPALVALAESRGALRRIEPAARSFRLGDLLVFDRVVAAEPASLVAVVVSVDDRGVVEYVYLARGVVRRGFVSPAEPSARRDAAGRILNTFVRHSDGTDPGGTRTLAGELLAATISLRQLLR